MLKYILFVFIHCRQFCHSGNGATTTRNCSQITRTPTNQTNTTNARHFTFGFQDGVFQTVMRTETSLNNESEAVKNGEANDNAENTSKL